MYYKKIFILISFLFIFSNTQFYLALENSLCEEYVTEKFWKLLHYNVIPVLLNGENMTRQAPPHSYIDLKDFPSVQGRAVFLCFLRQFQYLPSFLKTNSHLMRRPMPIF